MLCAISTNEEGRASRAPAKETNRPRHYPKRATASRVKRLRPAADVLLLLQFPLSSVTRTAFVALLARRIERAYAGGRR